MKDQVKFNLMGRIDNMIGLNKIFPWMWDSCAKHSRLSFVGGTSLQRDLQDSIVESNEEGPVTVQDLQAQDWFPHPWWEELHLLQVTTL